THVAAHPNWAGEQRTASAALPPACSIKRLGRAPALLGDGVASIVQCRLDGVHRDLAGVEAQVDRLGWDVGAHRLDAAQLAERAVDRLHAVLAAHIWN